MSEIISGNNNAWKFVAAGLLATATLHGGLELENLPHGPRVEGINPFSGEETNERNLGTIAYGDPYITTEDRHTGIKGDAIDYIHKEFSLTGAHYAREFSDDESSRELEITTLKTVAQSIENLRQEKYKKIVLKIRGWVSAEDDAIDGTAGLQSASVKNAELGVTRRDSFIDGLKKETSLDDVEIVYLETNENMFTDEQVDALSGLSDSYGYADVDDLVTSYNEGKAPIEVDALLDKWLDEKRGVGAEVSGYKVILGEGEQQLEQVKVCIKPEADFVEISKNTIPYDATIPWGVFVMGAALTASAFSDNSASKKRARQDSLAWREGTEQRRFDRIETYINGLLTSDGLIDIEKLTEDHMDIRQTDVEKMKELLSPVQREIIEIYITKQELARIERHKAKQAADREQLKKIAFGFVKFGIPAMAVVGGVIYLAEACSPNMTPRTSTPAPKSTDPCAGTDEIRTVNVGTKTVHYRDGRYVSTDFDPAESK